MRALLVIALLALLPASADAAFFRAVQVDQGTAGDVDLAPVGSGALTYVKAGHVFVSNLVRGAPSAPAQVDQGQTPASSQPRVAASSSGRVLVVWVNEGKLWAASRPGGGAQFSGPALAYSAAPVADPAVSRIRKH